MEMVRSAEEEEDEEDEYSGWYGGAMFFILPAWQNVKSFSHQQQLLKAILQNSQSSWH